MWGLAGAFWNFVFQPLGTIVSRVQVPAERKRNKPSAFAFQDFNSWGGHPKHENAKNITQSTRPYNPYTTLAP